MKRIKLLIELKYDDKIMHSDDLESVTWFYKDILGSKRKNDFTLYSKEIGDEVGTVKVLEIITPYQS